MAQSLDSLNPLAQIVLRQVFEVFLDTVRALISYLYPCFSLVNKLDYFSTYCSQITTSSLYLLTIKVYIVFENVVRFDIPFTLLQIVLSLRESVNILLFRQPLILGKNKRITNLELALKADLLLSE